MTESFYIKLLDFLSASEKQTIFSCLEKNKFKVKGFRSLKEVPIPHLAPLLAKKETAIIHALKDLSGNYSSSEEALFDFKNGNITKSFSYLLTKTDITEEQLIGIIDTTSSEAPTQYSEKDVEELKAKLAEEKAKYQSTRKEYLTLKKELNKVKKENEKLQDELNATNITIEALSASSKKSKEENGLLTQKLEQIRNSLNKQIQILQKENEDLRTLNQEAAKAPTLVLLKDRKSIPLNWVLVRTYDFIASLNNENVLDYSEILYVYNEMPLSLRIKISRIEEAQKKVKTFTTNYELMQYIKEARK